MTLKIFAVLAVPVVAVVLLGAGGVTPGPSGGGSIKNIEATDAGVRISNQALVTHDVTTPMVCYGDAGCQTRPYTFGGRRVASDNNDIAVWTMDEVFVGDAGVYPNVGTGANPYDGGSGSGDMSRNTPTKTTSGTMGVFGNAFRVDDIGGWYGLSTGTGFAEPSTAITVSGWVNWTRVLRDGTGYDVSGAWPAFGVMIWKHGTGDGSRHGIGFNDNTSTEFYVNLTDVSKPDCTTWFPNMDQWHHVGFTWSKGGQLIGYVDGTAVCSAASNNYPLDYAGHGAWQIGDGKANVSCQSAKARYDDFRIANTVRSAAWFREVYRSAMGFGAD